MEGGLEVKLPTIWTDGQAEVEREKDKKKSRKDKIRRKKMPMREKVEQLRNSFFQCLVAPDVRKSLKR